MHMLDMQYFAVTSLDLVGDLILLPTGSEEREVLGVGGILVAILPSCQFMKNITG